MQKPALKRRIANMLISRGRTAFLLKYFKNGNAILDCGCGNNCSHIIKSICPSSHYTGIDVCDYDQSLHGSADKYIAAKPETFTDKIMEMPDSFDIVISSHNLEHCDYREKTLTAICSALRAGGFLYLSFPAENSVNFPCRKGTLNYYDDKTHKDLPPDYKKTIEMLKANNMEIIYAVKSHKPVLFFILGAIIEPVSGMLKRLLSPWALFGRATWSYYGFESIIWAKKKF